MKKALTLALILTMGGCKYGSAQSIIDHAPSCSDSDIAANLTKQMLSKLKLYMNFIGEPKGRVKDVFTISHEQYTSTCIATFELTATVKSTDGTQPEEKTTESDVEYTAIVSDDGRMNRVGIK